VTAFLSLVGGWIFQALGKSSLFISFYLVGVKMNVITKIRWVFIALIAILSVYLLARVIDIIVPFIVGAIMAYLLRPMVIWLQKKGLRRRGSVAVIFIWIVFLSALIIFMVLPILYSELGKLAIVLPDRIQIINNYIETVRNNYSQSGLPSEVNKLFDDQLQHGQNFLVNWLKNILQNLPGILTSIGLLIFITKFSLFISCLIGQKISDGVINLVPGRLRGEWLRFIAGSRLSYPTLYSG